MYIVQQEEGLPRALTPMTKSSDVKPNGVKWGDVIVMSDDVTGMSDYTVITITECFLGTRHICMY